MKLPNFEKAIIDIEKLRDYCLSFEHPVGKHKALMFKKKLNFSFADSYKLKDEIADAVSKNEAHETFSDEYGKRFFVDVKIVNFDKSEMVRTLWIVKKNENFPRFISCYIKN